LGPIPNPQSPIPNPHLIIIYNLINSNKINYYKENIINYLN